MGFRLRDTGLLRGRKGFGGVGRTADHRSVQSATVRKGSRPLSRKDCELPSSLEGGNERRVGKLSVTFSADCSR